MTKLGAKPSARDKILAAAVSIIRTKGYAATSVEELCAAAGVTKGAFFHHYKSKDDLGIAAAEHWSETIVAMFERAPYHAYPDPLDRVLGYVDFRKAILKGPIAKFTCLVGTVVQEAYQTHPAVRDACARAIASHAAPIEADIAEAMRGRDIQGTWSARSLALHIQAVVQGAFVLVKATEDRQAAIDSLDHLRRYVEVLFGPALQPQARHSGEPRNQNKNLRTSIRKRA